MRIFVLFIILLLSGCIYVDPSDEIQIAETVEPKVIRLTQEKIVSDKDGNFIIVTFPKQSFGHDCFLDEETGEYVVIGELPK